VVSEARVILGVDPGYAKCGWSIVEPGTGRVRALGLIQTMKHANLHVSADRAKRVGKVCGAVLMLARMAGFELVEITAKDWQQAVLGGDPKRKWKKGEKYKAVERALTSYVGEQLADALDGLDKNDRRHSIDSTGVAMCAALMPHMATRIVMRKEAA
jgi:Holliday junction resolvasome RuvABC endonuclease subunit